MHILTHHVFFTYQAFTIRTKLAKFECPKYLGNATFVKRSRFSTFHDRPCGIHVIKFDKAISHVWSQNEAYGKLWYEHENKASEMWQAKNVGSFMEIDRYVIACTMYLLTRIAQHEAQFTRQLLTLHTLRRQASRIMIQLHPSTAAIITATSIRLITTIITIIAKEQSRGIVHIGKVTIDILIRGW